jgi:hypothetical protein
MKREILQQAVEFRVARNLRKGEGSRTKKHPSNACS